MTHETDIQTYRRKYYATLNALRVLGFEVVDCAAPNVMLLDEEIPVESIMDNGLAFEIERHRKE